MSHAPAPVKANNKVTLVTGATSGIGLVTARTLAGRGQQVVMVGRNPAKTRQLARALGCDYLLADLSELAQVRALAGQFRERYDRLDVLINNAGALFAGQQYTSQGTEMTWTLNHLSPFLLTRELMSLLLVTPGARVITVASLAHQAARIRFEDPEFRRGYSAWGAYAQSKLANILFARELARRGGGLQSYALHPGVVASSFGNSAGGALSQFYRVFNRFTLTPELGAQTSIDLATTDGPLPNGGYFVKSAPARPSARALDDGVAARLWALSEKYVETGIGN